MEWGLLGQCVFYMWHPHLSPPNIAECSQRRVQVAAGAPTGHFCVSPSYPESGRDSPTEADTSDSSIVGLVTDNIVVSKPLEAVTAGSQTPQDIPLNVLYIGVLQ